MNCPCWRYSYKSKSARTEGQHLGALAIEQHVCDASRCALKRFVPYVSRNRWTSTPEGQPLSFLRRSLAFPSRGLEQRARYPHRTSAQAWNGGSPRPAYISLSLPLFRKGEGGPAGFVSFFLQGYDGFVSLFLSAGLWARELPPFRLSLSPSRAWGQVDAPGLKAHPMFRGLFLSAGLEAEGLPPLPLSLSFAPSPPLSQESAKCSEGQDGPSKQQGFDLRTPAPAIASQPSVLLPSLLLACLPSFLASKGGKSPARTEAVSEKPPPMFVCRDKRASGSLRKAPQRSRSSLSLPSCTVNRQPAFAQHSVCS